MKTKQLISAATFSALLIVSNSAFAGETKTQKQRDNDKAAATLSTMVIGGLVGGPVGAFIGAVTGSLAAEHADTKHQQQELTIAMNEVEEMKAQLEKDQQRASAMEQKAAEKLEFQVLFTTGSDELSQTDLKRVNSVARYLNTNPELKVNLEGHADPRGTDEYNYVLSEERVKSVIKALEEKGIDRSRVTYSAYGSDLSTAYQGDLEAYALDRRVKIDVVMKTDNSVASSH
ncbi:OmpA family protein [Saccharophagus degradans]|uniref:OmpA/MotB n=1 Tax=Saccharophagus degradans (strain 2-40 / ATCC 43961 / DSM 17024) TaxID=203122 RepID=Q21HJ9_SACD2|nr:OmpA family protein [Saccharophagus degradans]ABD81830.1 OmpA/MotB [Saccharophagus degradans 2-40]